MFDIVWDEMAVIAVVALVVIGPKDLPVVLRQAGRWTRKLRVMAGEFQHSLEEMARENELDTVKAQVEKAADPNLLRREIEKTIDPTGDIARSLEPPVMTDHPAMDGDAPITDIPVETPVEAQIEALDLNDPVKPPQP